MVERNHHLIHHYSTIVYILQFHPRRGSGRWVSEILLHIAVETIPKRIMNEVNSCVMNGMVDSRFSTRSLSEVLDGGHGRGKQDLKT